ncbi:MAG: hypothetical protein KF712_19380 [Akkermansiaceae bacterium]|nr:hypothetical protein [Akkermansiaceae bacterium]
MKASPLKAYLWRSAAIAAALQTGHLMAQENGGTPAAPKAPPSLSAEEKQASLEILPLPGEILSVLKTAKAADWAASAEAARKSSELAGSKDSRLAAIGLGIRVADAFLAIQAEDGKLLDVASIDIFQAAAKLGASEEVLAHAADIKAKAAAGKWKELTGPLDLTYQDALKTMEELGDTDSASVALIAGWTRGVEIFAGQLSKSYSPEGGKALRQVSLLETLEAKFNALPQATRDTPEIASLGKGLAALKPLVSVAEDATVSEEATKKIAEIAKGALPDK